MGARGERRHEEEGRRGGVESMPEELEQGWESLECGPGYSKRDGSPGQVHRRAREERDLESESGAREEEDFRTGVAYSRGGGVSCI